MRSSSLIAIASLCLLGAVDQSQQGRAPESELANETDYSADEMVTEGRRLANSTRYDEAIQAFTLALSKEPQNGHALASRSLAYAATNRVEQAVRDLEAAERLISGEPILNRARAFIAMRRGESEKALAELTESLDKEPTDPFALYYRAWLYQNGHDDDEALADAEAYVKAHPRAAEAYVLRAELLLAQEKRELAVAEADRLMSRFRGAPEPMAAAARIYDRVGHRDRALEAINAAVEGDPNSFVYRYLRSRIHRWDNFQDRRADLEAALEISPAHLDAVTELALLDMKQRRWREAVAGFSAILQKEPADFGVLAYRAMAYLSSDQPALAERDHRAALRAASAPGDLSRVCGAYANEGIALDWALDACNRALAAKPNNSDYLANRGLANLRAGRLDDALGDFDQAIARDGREARAYYGRAIVRARKGDTATAEADRKRALELDPTIADDFRSYGFKEY